MTSVPTVPGQAAVLPPWLAAKKVQTNYAEMIISPPRPIRASINKKGQIEFKTPKGVNMNPMDEINGVIMAFSRPRVFWKEKGSTEGRSPDCSSVDGVKGDGRHVVEIGQKALVPTMTGEYPVNDTEAPLIIERACSSCPWAQYGSGDGNSQACKQTIRLGMYVPTVYPVKYNDDGSPAEWSEASLSPWWSDANNESWPEDGAPPLIFTISPTGIREFESYVRWMESNGAPMEAYWTTIKGGTTTFGQWTVGVPEFGGQMMSDGQEWYYDYARKLSEHTVVADIKAAGGSDDYVVE